MAKDVHFGVTIPQIKRTWEEAKTASIEFEAMGYDSLWVCDHLYGPQSPSIPILEAWSELAAVAAITSKVELGTLVTPAGMRNPAHLGKIIATVDNIAGGRVIAGLGGGWMTREFTDFGVPFLPTGQRLGQLRETVELLRRMWDPAEGEVTFEGKHINVQNVVTEPKPPRRVPILIGGSGENVTLKLVAQHADWWNNSAGNQSNLERKVGVLRQHCEAIGRDPEEITVSQQCLVTIAPDDASAGPMIDTAKKIFGGHMGDPTGPLAIAGSPERVKEQIQKHIDLGCTAFVMEFFGRDTKTPAQLFADKVLPAFK
ncbi:MAG: LLM class flavin-dependent oxidoreductase [Dehalococcoidia bacterium]